MEFEGTHGEIYKEGEGVIVMIDRGSIIIIKKKDRQRDIRTERARER